MFLNYIKSNNNRTFKKAVLLSASIFCLQTELIASQLDQLITWRKCDIVLHKKAFEICYSCSKKHPLTVSYSVDGEKIDAKNLSRKGLRFRPDYQLPARCRSYPRDYSRTGYDRGHLAPNALFDYDRKIQKETFLMSNIAPQKPQLNRRLWAKIEKFVRILARRHGGVDVVTGVCGDIGQIKHGVNIPAYWYKIIRLPNDKIISFLAPNSNRGMKKVKLKKFLVDLKEIEKKCSR